MLNGIFFLRFWTSIWQCSLNLLCDVQQDQTLWFVSFKKSMHVSKRIRCGCWAKACDKGNVGRHSDLQLAKLTAK